MEFLRGIIKWIILAILFVIFIVLIINVANKTSKKPVTKDPSVNVVEKSPTPTEPELQPIDDQSAGSDSMTVDSPDTASTGLPHIIVGLVILSFGAGYIFKNRNVKGNS